MERAYNAAFKKHAKNKHPSRELMQSVAMTAMSRLRQELIRELLDNFEKKGAKFQKALREFFKMAMEEEKKKISVLPPGTKYFIKSAKEHLYVIEQPPQIRTVFGQKYKMYDDYWYEYTGSAHGKQSYGISLPYLIFFVLIKSNKGYYYQPKVKRKRVVKGPKQKGQGFQEFNCQCFFRNEPLRNMDDMLYHPPIPNREEPHMNLMCLGKRSTPYPMDPFGAVRWVIEQFFNTVFTGVPSDWDDGDGSIVNQKVSNFEEWEKATKKQPFFSLKVKWKKCDTLLSMVNKTIDYYGWDYEEENLHYQIEGFVDDLFSIMGGGSELTK